MLDFPARMDYTKGGPTSVRLTGKTGLLYTPPISTRGGIMLSITANDRHRYCDGLSRRSFLRAGFLGAAGLALPDWLRFKANAADAGQTTKDTAVILIWLDGGPTHMDTYDVKSAAPAEYRGAMKTTRTN